MGHQNTGQSCETARRPIGDSPYLVVLTTEYLVISVAINGSFRLIKNYLLLKKQSRCNIINLASTPEYNFSGLGHRYAPIVDGELPNVSAYRLVVLFLSQSGACANSDALETVSSTTTRRHEFELRKREANKRTELSVSFLFHGRVLSMR